MGDTAIGWTHRPGTRGRTWNPVRGCRRKSTGCERCYAEVQAARIVRMGKGRPTPYDGIVKLVNGEPRWTGEIALDADRLAEPLRWQQPSTIFVDSMSDLFYDRRPNEHIAAVFGVMAACPRHTFLILTKYADRMRAWFEWAEKHGDEQDLLRFGPSALLTCAWEASTGDVWGDDDDGRQNPQLLDLPNAATYGTRWPLPNVWLGVSVENQDALIERWPDLYGCPAAVHFFSAEPLLGALDFAACFASRRARELWLIDDCESGPGARPAKREWFREIEGQCHVAGIPYFHKQEFIDGKLVHDFPGRQAFPEAR